MDFHEWQQEARKAAMSVGEKTEEVFVKQFGGHRVTDKDLQYKDIDVLFGGQSWSIKDMRRATAQYGNVSFETELENTATGKRRPGNYATCEADMYAIAITYNGEPYWFIQPVEEMKKWIDDNQDKYPTKPLSWKLREDNRRQGRVYNNAFNFLVPVEVIAQEFGNLKPFEDNQ